MNATLSGRASALRADQQAPAAMELAGMPLVGAALAIVSWDTIRMHREVEPLMGQE